MGESVPDKGDAAGENASPINSEEDSGMSATGKKLVANSELPVERGRSGSRGDKVCSLSSIEMANEEGVVHASEVVAGKLAE